MQMRKRIVIIVGHPDPDPARLCKALARVYADEAQKHGHEVRGIDISKLDFPVLRTKEEFEKGIAPSIVAKCQDDIRWSQHLVIIFPLWLGDMPALLKAILEQIFRPTFAFDAARGGKLPKKLLSGRSARIIVTMGMPAFFYRLFYRAHGLKNLKRNILGFSGISPVHETLVGLVEQPDSALNALTLAEKLGRTAT